MIDLPVNQEQLKTPAFYSNVGISIDPFSVVALGTTKPKVAYSAEVFFTKSDFDKMVDKWHGERSGMSSPRDVFSCPSYVFILNEMGKKALPFIIRNLKENPDRPDDWFHALRAITKFDAISDVSHHGNKKAMAKDWLEWWDRSYAGI